MITNYLKTALRNLSRNKVSSIINLFGMAVGLACAIVIFSYVVNELSYDNFHEKKDRIYRVACYQEISGKGMTSAITSPAMGPDMINELPEIEDMVRFTTTKDGFFQYDEQAYQARNIVFADSTVFNIFSFELKEGNKDALSESNTVLLTKKYAEKIFGDESPIGKVIYWNGNLPLKVEGILEDLPQNSHIQFNALISFSAYIDHYKPWIGWDGNFSFFTYVLLNNESAQEQLEARFPDFLYEKINKKYEEFGAHLDMFLQPLSDVYLYSNLDHENEVKGNINNLYYLSGIALLIIILATINYTNLMTARSVRRGKEVGVRKVLGANRKMIFAQFVGETLLISIMAFILALILSEIARPFINTIMNAQINIYGFDNIPYFLFVIVLTVIIGIIAGIYPAVFMSGFMPQKVLKGDMFKGTSKPVIRKILVIVQFVISSILIISTIMIFQQYSFVKDKNLGFDKTNVKLIALQSKNSQQTLSVLQEKLEQIPGVEATAASSDILGRGLTMNGYVPDGAEQPVLFNYLQVDRDFLDLMGIKLIKGRDFSEISGPGTLDLLVNETLVEDAGWENPVGKKIFRDTNYNVLGVIPDFHFNTLYNKIGPLVIEFSDKNDFYWLSVKTNSDNPVETNTEIEKIWNEVNPGESIYIVNYDQFLGQFYAKDKQFGKLLFYFTLLAILISALGVFGLVLYTAQQRTKEIGIRKTFGSSTKNIISLLTGELFKLIIIANLVSWPISWFIMHEYLEKFAYSTGVQIPVFVYTLAITLVIALLTTIAVIYRVAKSNPVEALKYE